MVSSMNIRWLWCDYVPNDITLTKSQRRLINERAWAEMRSGRALIFMLLVVVVGSIVAVSMLHYILPASVHWLSGLTSGPLVLLNFHLSFWIFARPHVLRIVRDVGVNVCPDCGYDLIGQKGVTISCPECGWTQDDHGGDAA